MYTRTGVLTAGGHAVHRVRAPEGAKEEPQRKTDLVAIIERYQDIAAHMHKTAIAPRGDKFLWGCSCGSYGIAHEPGRRSAELVAMKHTLDKAQEMYETLEGHKPGENDGQ